MVGLAWDGCSHRACLPVGRVDRNGGPRELRRRTRQSRATACRRTAGSWSATRRPRPGSPRARGGWTAGRNCFTGPGGLVGTANAANSDGSIVVGRVCNPAAARPAIRLSKRLGVDDTGRHAVPARASLRVSPGPLIIVEANATSDDGRVIGGGQNVGGSEDSNAVLWIDRVPFYLKDYLRANGVPNAFATWVNTGSITDISPDGRILVGKGAARLGFRGYIVILGDTAMKRFTAGAVRRRPAGAVGAGAGAIVGSVRHGRPHPIGRPRPPGAGAERTRHPGRVHVGRSRRRVRSLRTGAPRSCGRSNPRRSGSRPGTEARTSSR